MNTIEGEESCIRLFLSVDLVGSTAFKQEADTKWVGVFKEFYTGFPQFFNRKMRNGWELSKQLQPKLIKAIGDELFLQVTIANAKEALHVVRFFGKALSEYKEQNLDKKLLLKGTAWIGGFPINNSRVALEDEDKKLFMEDYIGPSIDTGFRLCRFSTPIKLVVSVDLALLLLHETDEPISLHFDGAESLKGVLDGRPYPVIWHPVGGTAYDLHNLELEVRAQKTDRSSLKRYCEKYLQISTDERAWLFKPYFKEDEHFNIKPPHHIKIFEDRKRVDARNYSGNGPADGATQPAAATPEST